MRESAGSPTYRVLSGRASFSVTTLAVAAAGRVLPTLAVTRAYVLACGGDVDAWEQRWHRVAAGRSAEATSENVAAGPSPYLGLGAFQLSDASVFFGRETLTDDLEARVAGQSLVMVFGASGSGKSSLLRAGLMARWTDKGGRCQLVTPGRHPLDTFQASSTELLASPDRHGDVLLVIDQFEETFTLCRDEDERAAFVTALVQAAQPDTGLRIVLGVRNDFYGHCADQPSLAAVLQDSQFLVARMNAEQIRDAIVRPAVSTGATVESSLLATLVADCAGQPGVLPLLSHALRETWQRRRGMTMTLAGYQAAGGIAHAIAQTAELTYAGCDERGQQVMRSLFLRLTALGEGTEDTKRRIELADVDDPGMLVVLEQLTQARLVIMDDNWVEIAHEALIRNWPRLSDWLTRDRDGLRMHQELAVAARQWEALDRDADALYRGVRLAQAEEWATGETVLTGREREFLAASTSARKRAQSVARRRMWGAWLLFAVLGVVLFVAYTPLLPYGVGVLVLAVAAIVHAIRALSRLRS